MNGVALIEMPGPSRHPAIADRYEAMVARGNPDACWNWNGQTDRLGYGVIKVKRRGVRAHRLGFQLRHGWLPPVVRHTCDNRQCQNPRHWKPGTQADNVQDAVERHRTAAGTKNGSSKLTEAKVREARQRHAAGESMRALARDMNVSNPTMLKALRRETWRHVD